MTNHDPTPDQANRSAQPSVSSIAEVHQPMSTAGVALGEAHQHLAGLYRAGSKEQQSEEVRAAELRALRQSLKDAQQAVSNAMDCLNQIEAKPTGGTKDDGSDTSGIDEPEEPIPDILWNTTTLAPTVAPPVRNQSDEQHRSDFSSGADERL